MAINTSSQLVIFFIGFKKINALHFEKSSVGIIVNFQCSKTDDGIPFIDAVLLGHKQCCLQLNKKGTQDLCLYSNYDD